MSSGVASRRRLFNKFSDQLHLLVGLGILQIDLKYDKTYICPICLDQFGEEHLEYKKGENYLTEEDAPPAALNGRRIALTCHKCNSQAGHQIDNHLFHAIKELDDSKFAIGNTFKASIEYEGKRISADITSKGDGNLEVFHKIRNNDPNLLDKFIYALKNKLVGPFLNMTRKGPVVDSDRVNRSLLKATYIITFAQFGYIFLLDTFYNNIRSEINDMNYKAKGQIFVPYQLTEEQIGTFYIHNPGAKSFLNVFSLKTDYSNTIIGSIFPRPNSTPEEIQYHLTLGAHKNKDGYVSKLDLTKYDTSFDIFTNANEIAKVFTWVYNE